MQVYLNPTPQGFWDRDTLPGLSTYIDHSLTHSLTSYNCFRLALTTATFQWWCRCIWTPPLKVSGTETLSRVVHLHRSLTHSLTCYLCQSETVIRSKWVSDHVGGHPSSVSVPETLRGGVHQLHSRWLQVSSLNCFSGPSTVSSEWVSDHCRSQGCPPT